MPQRLAVLVLALLAARLAAGAAIQGQVIDDADRPVAGATVWAEVSPGLDQVAPEPVATTDADGRFATERALGEVEGARVLVLAWHPERGLAWDMRSGLDPIVLRLVPCAEVAGQVTDAQDRPIPGATVELREVSPRGRLGRYANGLPLQGLTDDAPLSTTTGADGRWRLRAVPPGGTATLLIRHPAWASQWLGVRAGEPLPPVRLVPGATLAGRVVAQGVDVPLEHLRLTALRADRNDRAVVRPQPDGSYEIAGLRGGVYQVALEAGPDAAAPALGPTTVALGQRVAGQDFLLTPGTLIEGSVVSTVDGRPLADLFVSVDGAGWPFSDRLAYRAASDAEGRFRLRVPPGESRLRADTRLSGEQPEAGVTVNAVPGEAVRRVELRVDPGRELAGRVVDEQGAPVRDATLTAAQERCLQDAWLGPDGGFRFRFLQPGEPVQLTLREPDVDLEPLQIDLARTEADLTVTVRRVALVPLTGRVVDSEGRPVAGAAVSVRTGPPDRPRLWDRIWADADGQYRLAQAPRDQRVTVTAALRGFEPRGEVAAAVDGDRLVAPPVVMEARGGRISGVVLDAAGEPVAGAVVIACGGGGLTQTGGDGRFELVGLPEAVPLPHAPARRWTVVAQRGRRELAKVEGALAGQDLTLRQAEPPMPHPPEEAHRALAATLLREALEARPMYRAPSPPDRVARLAEVDPAAAREALEAVHPLPARGPFIERFFRSLIPSAPAAALELVDFVDELPSPLDRADLRTWLALRLADRAQARALLERAREEFDQGGGNRLERAEARALLAGAERAAGLPGEDLDPALAALLALPHGDQLAGRLVLRLTPAPDLGADLLARLPVTARDPATLAAAVRLVAHTSPKAAWALWQRWFPGDGPILRPAPRPETQPAPPGEAEAWARFDAARVVAMALAPTQPEPAVALARRLEPAKDRFRLVLALAARVSDAELAETLVAEAGVLLLSQPWGVDWGDDRAARLAAVASVVAPEQAERWRGEALGRWQDDPQSFEPVMAWSRDDPNTARLVLERALARLQGEGALHEGHHRTLAVAYASFDLDEAVIPARATQEQGRLAAWLMAPPSARLTRAFFPVDPEQPFDPLGVW